MTSEPPMSFARNFPPFACTRTMIEVEAVVVVAIGSQLSLSSGKRCCSFERRIQRTWGGRPCRAVVGSPLPVLDPRYPRLDAPRADGYCRLRRRCKQEEDRHGHP